MSRERSDMQGEWREIQSDERVIGLTVNPALTYLQIMMIPKKEHEEAYNVWQSTDKLAKRDER